MHTMFDNVQLQFMNIGTLLSDVELNNHHLKADLMARVHESVNETYALINEDFCNELHQCEKCLANRDQLGCLTQMMKACEEEGKISHELCQKLSEFRDNIPNILNKMEAIYLENIQYSRSA